MIKRFISAVAFNTLPRLGKMGFRPTLVGMALATCCLVSASSTYYVKPTGNDKSDGLTWATAFGTPQQALSVAIKKGDQIWVKAGNYPGEFVVNSSTVQFLGGFAGTETLSSQRSPSKNITTLDGLGKSAVIDAQSLCTNSTLIDGFVITDSNSSGGIMTEGSPTISNNLIQKNTGPGINSSAAPTIMNNTITANAGSGIVVNGPAQIIGNTITRNSSSTDGGGILDQNGDDSTGTSHVTIQGNDIEFNSAKGSGGGIRILAGSPIIGTTVVSTVSTSIGNKIVQNSAGGTGGGMGLDGTKYPLVQSNLVDSNSAKGNGGGIEFSGLAIVLANNKVTNNVAGSAGSGSGGGAYLVSNSFSDPAADSVQDNLFDGNQSYGEGGGAYIEVDAYGQGIGIQNNTVTNNNSSAVAFGCLTVGCQTYSSVFVRNNIVARNSSGLHRLGANNFDTDYNCVFDAGIQAQYEYNGFNVGKHDIQVDPIFVNPTATPPNLQIASKSPCLDGGDSSHRSLTDYDLAGNARISDTVVDMGCYEFVYPTISTVSISPNPAGSYTKLTGTVTLASAAPTGGATVTFGSDTPSVIPIPASIAIAAGKNTGSFAVTAGAVTTSATVKLSSLAKVTTGAAPKLAPTMTTEVVSPWVKSVSVNPTTVSAGNTVTVTVSLNAPAPANGLTVQLKSDSSKLGFVDSTGKPNQILNIVIAGGSTTATQVAAANSVTKTTTATISASSFGVAQTTTLTITPSIILSIAFTPNTVDAGGTVIGIVSLSLPVTSPTTIALASADPVTAPVPSSVTIPTGFYSAPFTITTNSVSANKVIPVTATYNAVSQFTNLTVLYNPPASLTLWPDTVQGGSSTFGIVFLNSPAAADTTVTLSVPASSGVKLSAASVVIPKGKMTATFTASTPTVTKNTSTTLTATISGQALSRTLTITP